MGDGDGDEKEGLQEQNGMVGGHRGCGQRKGEGEVERAAVFQIARQASRAEQCQKCAEEERQLAEDVRRKINGRQEGRTERGVFGDDPSREDAAERVDCQRIKCERHPQNEREGRVESDETAEQPDELVNERRVGGDEEARVPARVPQRPPIFCVMVAEEYMHVRVVTQAVARRQDEQTMEQERGEERQPNTARDHGWLNSMRGRGMRFAFRPFARARLNASA